MNFKYTKSYGTAMYPVHTLQTSGLLQRIEPFLTPEQLKSRFLKGIPLVFFNGDKFTDAEFKDRIYLAQNQAELNLNVTITRELRQEKLAFKREDYKAYIHLKASQGPLCSIHQLAIVSADKNVIFEIPPQWIETANFNKNLINVIPLLAAYGVSSVQGAVGNAGIAFLAMMDGLNWTPAYWQIQYTSGVSNQEGTVPSVVNEYIGCIAAIEILSQIAATFIYNSQSQSQDGISQSSTGPGPRIYMLRIQELEKRIAKLERKLKAIFSQNFFVGGF